MNSSNCNYRDLTSGWVGCGLTLDFRPSYVPSPKLCGKLCAALISCLLDAAMLLILWFVAPWCESNGLSRHLFSVQFLVKVFFNIPGFCFVALVNVL